jgi:Pentapeptide repeats (9 copies)
MSWLSSAWQWYATGTTSNAAIVNPIIAAIGATALVWAAIRQAVIASNRHYEQTEADRQRRITETFSKASEQLASDKVEVRLGAIYTFGRLLEESERDYWPILEMLSAFVRTRAPWNPNGMTPQDEPPVITRHSSKPLDPRKIFDPPPIGVKPPVDIAAVLKVIKKRPASGLALERKNYWQINLSGCDLRGADLRGASLWFANFSWSRLDEANLQSADLSAANFTGAQLRSVFLNGATINGTIFRGTHLEGSSFGGATIENTLFVNSHLERAYLTDTRGLSADAIRYATGDEETMLPPGLSRPHSWIVRGE